MVCQIVDVCVRLCTVYFDEGSLHIVFERRSPDAALNTDSMYQERNLRLYTGQVMFAFVGADDPVAIFVI
jgi:hypothetical protein